jgi:hypothetical protein
MFAPTKLIEDALQSIIQENYPYAGKVEYRSYELQFSEPIKCDNELGKRMQELYDKKGEFQYT